MCESPRTCYLRFHDQVLPLASEEANALVVSSLSSGTEGAPAMEEVSLAPLVGLTGNRCSRKTPSDPMAVPRACRYPLHQVRNDWKGPKLSDSCATSHSNGPRAVETMGYDRETPARSPQCCSGPAAMSRAPEAYTDRNPQQARRDAIACRLTASQSLRRSTKSISFVAGGVLRRLFARVSSKSQTGRVMLLA